MAIDKNDGELADLLDEGPSTKKQEKKAMLARENMMSSAKQQAQAPVEEVKRAPVKPSFTGKLNLRGAGADTGASGVTTNYDFTAKYKSDFKEGEEKPKKQAKPQSFNITGGKMGSSFAAAEAQAAANSQVDEDGFEIVGGGNDRKARRQNARARQDEK